MQLRRLRQLAGLFVFVVLIAACSKGSSSGDVSGSSSIAKSTMVAGKAVYEQHCLTCHLASGKGAPPMNPPLIATSFVLGDKRTLINIVLNGMSNSSVDGVNYKNVMPGLAFLTDDEVANVLTYVRNSFGNSSSEVSAVDVRQVRSTN